MTHPQTHPAWQAFKNYIRKKKGNLSDDYFAGTEDSYRWGKEWAAFKAGFEYGEGYVDYPLPKLRDVDE